MRELACHELYELEDCLKALADHHNRVSIHFKGTYPRRSYMPSRFP